MKRETTLKQAIANWKKGEIVWSISLGGFGPSYEQAIQIFLWEILSWWEGGPTVNEALERFTTDFDNHCNSIAKKLQLGLSGAQGMAARGVASRILTKGYQETLEEAGEDRHIMIDRIFPTVVYPEDK